MKEGENNTIILDNVHCVVISIVCLFYNQKFQKNTRSDIKIQNIERIERIESIESIESVTIFLNLKSLSL